MHLSPYCLVILFVAGWMGWLSQYSVWLETGRSRDHILVKVRFSLNVQASPEAHPTSHKMVIPRVFRGVRRPGSGVDHPPPCIVENVHGLELYLSLPSVPYTGMSWGHLYIYPLLLCKYSWYNLADSLGRATWSGTPNVKKIFRIKSVDFYWLYSRDILLTLHSNVVLHLDILPRGKQIFTHCRYFMLRHERFNKFYLRGGTQE
jgi:hypothetical protein